MRRHIRLIGAAAAIVMAAILVVTRSSEPALPNPPAFTVTPDRSLPTQAFSKRHGLTDVACSEEIDVI